MERTLEREGNERTRKRKDGGNWGKIWGLRAGQSVTRLQVVCVSTQTVRKQNETALSTGSDVVEPCQTDGHWAAIANAWASSWHDVCPYLATSALISFRHLLGSVAEVFSQLAAEDCLWPAGRPVCGDQLVILLFFI